MTKKAEEWKRKEKKNEMLDIKRGRANVMQNNTKRETKEMNRKMENINVKGRKKNENIR